MWAERIEKRGAYSPFFVLTSTMNKEKLREVTEAQLIDTDLFVVDITISSALDIEIALDSDTRVSIEQCMAISRAVEAAFDREAEDFSLTVASAGIGQPLKLARQLDKVVGKTVDVVLKKGERFSAVLKAHDAEGITISYTVKEVVEGKKRKVEVEKQENYKFTDIKTVCEALFV